MLNLDARFSPAPVGAGCLHRHTPRNYRDKVIDCTEAFWTGRRTITVYSWRPPEGLPEAPPVLSRHHSRRHGTALSKPCKCPPAYAGSITCRPFASRWILSIFCATECQLFTRSTTPGQRNESLLGSGGRADPLPRDWTGMEVFVVTLGWRV